MGTGSQAQERGGSLAGRVALVTGGARRLGSAIAERLAGEAARVVVHYRTSRREAERVAAGIAARGGQASLVWADLREPACARSLVRDVASREGRLDLLVNNASLFYPTPLARASEAEWDELLAVNLKSPFFAALEASRVLEDGGAIVNLTDASVATPWTDHVIYQVSKAGLAAATEYLARALAPRIRVNAVAPGPILMPEGASEEERERALRWVPLGRLGTPEDVAEAVLFAARTPYLTGVVIPVDGGRRLGRGPA